MSSLVPHGEMYGQCYRERVKSLMQADSSFADAVARRRSRESAWCKGRAACKVDDALDSDFAITGNCQRHLLVLVTQWTQGFRFTLRGPRFACLCAEHRNGNAGSK